MRICAWLEIPLGLPQSSSTLAPTQQHILTAGAAVLGVCAFPQLSACIAITLAAFWLESKLRGRPLGAVDTHGPQLGG